MKAEMKQPPENDNQIETTNMENDISRTETFENVAHVENRRKSHAGQIFEN